MKVAIPLATILSLSVLVAYLWAAQPTTTPVVGGVAHSLSDYQIEKNFSQRWSLPSALKEVSGVAINDGQIWVHDDEFAIVYLFDRGTGAVSHKLQLGESPITDDFEGIAVLGDDLFLLSSTGSLYVVREGKHKTGVVDHEVLETGLEDVCELEGLDPDLEDGNLVMVCKNMLDKSLAYVSVFTYELSTGLVTEQLRIPFSEVGKFHPSGITTAFGNYIVVAAKDRELIELTPEGKIVARVELGKKAHPQTEGIGFLDNQELVLTDEAKNKKARISLYVPTGTDR